MIDRDVLNVSQTLEALLLGGTKAGASSELLLAMYSELLPLIDPGDSPEVAVGILRRFPIERRIATAQVMMNSVRTNSLPSHRIKIARAIQDALRQNGLGENVLTQNLKPSQDDGSIKGSLYRHPTGETETIEQVAARLSNHDDIGGWNPYPRENANFDWWPAVKRTKIKNVSHLNDLLSSFPPSAYREIELLVWKSKNFLKCGDRENAILLAKQAIDRAKDGSWHYWLDGAKKKIAFGALKRVDKNDSISQARDQFGKELAEGKLDSSLLLNDILEMIDFLELDWPEEPVCQVINDYLDHVLAANPEIAPFESMIQTSKEGSVDEALCRFLVHLLAFPVLDVGIAARRTLSQYVRTSGNRFAELVKAEPCWDSVQLEHILVSLHVGSQDSTRTMNSLKDWILNLNLHESIAVRSIARRLCEEQGWPWKEINDQAKQPVIFLSESLASPSDYEETRMVVGGDIARAYQLHHDIFAKLEKFGLDPDELKSELYPLFRENENDFRWADENRLKHWMNQVLARQKLNPRAIIGREAAMRVLGRRSLSGQVPSGAEQTYDYFYPIYDSKLELCQPIERPVELQAMEWDLWDAQREAWLKGENANSWSDYPESIDVLHIIGERTLFIRPDWEWPKEERRRSLVVGSCDSGLTQKCLQTSHDVTFENYPRGLEQDDEQLIVFNSELHQLGGSAYRWATINSNFARKLGWHPSEDEPFEWIDSSGNLMVKSVYWKDGWIWLEPPRFESLGEGWLVLSTDQGIRSIREASDKLELHLWVERQSHGEKPYEGKWHLSKSV